MTGVRVTMQHARQARLDGQRVTCAPGVRAWCVHHGVDLRAFGRDGLPVEQVEAIGDAFALRAARIAREEAEHGQEQR
jgi:hypothetical protein